MSLVLQPDPQTSFLRLEGTFTFDGHARFRDVTQAMLEEATGDRIVLDLSGLAYMDSSALGMLLLLKEKAEMRGLKVVLAKPSGAVMQILRIVQFGRIFEIQED